MSATIGQEFNASQVMIVIVDSEGQAHAWDVNPVSKAKWAWTGVGTSGRSTADITISGEFHRRTRNLAGLLNQLEK